MAGVALLLMFAVLSVAFSFASTVGGESTFMQFFQQRINSSILRNSKPIVSWEMPSERT
jgi:hypothetical protein